MIFFDKLVINNLNQRHDNRPIWKYHLNDEMFNDLKLHLKNCNSLTQVSYKDAALFYAEWWKRDYNGGKPSKQEIYESLANPKFSADDLYKHAKIGAKLLGIKVIKKQNSLFFRSLLMQGGLPINHIKNNQTAYTSFLLKILDINPGTVDDFQFDNNVTKLLPHSSQNETIYDCCFEIVRAILDEDEGYLSIFENDEKLKTISYQLRKNKNTRSSYRKKSLIKPFWLLNIKNQEHASIDLRLSIPNSLELEDFNSIFGFFEQIDHEYKLLINDEIFCKFRRMLNGCFKSFIYKQNLRWDETEFLPEVSLVDSSGKKTTQTSLVSYFPNLNFPTMWTKFTDNEWILNKGKHTDQDEAILLFKDKFKLISDLSLSSQDIVLLESNQLNKVSFRGQIQLKLDDNLYSFKTNHQLFDWRILDEKPNWIYKSNLPITKDRLKILVYDREGKLINNPSIFWRSKSKTNWEILNNTIPRGFIEIKIVVNDSEETDFLFNIGNLKLINSSNQFNSGRFKIDDNEFLFQINEGKDYDVECISKNEFSIKLQKNEIIPKVIKASITFNNQSKSLLIELFPPFKGIELLNNNNEIVDNNSEIFYKKISGLRIMCNESNIILRLFNNKRRNIIISKVLDKGQFSLNDFTKDIIDKLLMLSDNMEKDGYVILEICRENPSTGNQSLIKSYKILHYSNYMRHEYNNEKTFITLDNYIEQSLLAIPLDCELNQIQLTPLYNKGISFEMPEVTYCQNFIVFSSDFSKDFKILPSFISTNPDNILTDTNDRIERVEFFKNLLLESKIYILEPWGKFLIYYNICVDNSLSFSTFDILRSVSHSSVLASKAFVFLTYHFKEDFSLELITQLEDEIGFSFHWINREDWLEAVGWMGCHENPDLFDSVIKKINEYFDSLYPSENFKIVKNFIHDDRIQFFAKSINEEITNLKQNLSLRVKNELPRKYPEISEMNKRYLPNSESMTQVNSLVIIPLAVALSISGKEYAIWRKDYEFIRRNIKYSQDIQPEWYSKAIHYYLSRIN